MCETESVLYRIALWETFGDAFTSFASFNRGRISAVGGAFDCRAGCRGFDSRGWTNPRVLKITGTSFALQTTGTSRGLGGHVKWWSCFQQETKISDLNKYFQVTSIFSLTITKLRRKLGEKSFP